MHAVRATERRGSRPPAVDRRARVPSPSPTRERVGRETESGSHVRERTIGTERRSKECKGGTCARAVAAGSTSSRPTEITPPLGRRIRRRFGPPPRTIPRSSGRCARSRSRPWRRGRTNPSRSEPACAAASCRNDDGWTDPGTMRRGNGPKPGGGRGSPARFPVSFVFSLLALFSARPGLRTCGSTHAAVGDPDPTREGRIRAHGTPNPGARQPSRSESPAETVPAPIRGAADASRDRSDERPRAHARSENGGRSGSPRYWNGSIDRARPVATSMVIVAPHMRSSPSATPKRIGRPVTR